MIGTKEEGNIIKSETIYQLTVKVLQLAAETNSFLLYAKTEKKNVEKSSSEGFPGGSQSRLKKSFLKYSIPTIVMPNDRDI